MPAPEPSEWRGKAGPYELGYCQNAFKAATIIIGPFADQELVDAVLPMLNTTAIARPRWYVAKSVEITRQDNCIVYMPSCELLRLALQIKNIRLMDVAALLGSEFIIESPGQEEV